MQDTALRDSRFQPVTKQEASTLNLKLSILSQPKKVDDYKNIVIGKHGIILKQGMHSAVFLPEVATEFGWNLEQTLNHLSQKAGLEKNGWKIKETSFSVFSTLDIE